MAKKRNYKDEYEKFQSSKKSKSDRAKRNTNRRRAIKEGKVHKGDDKELDHVDGDPQNNSKDNLRVISRSKNRAKH